jgi:hypothetical protein
LETAGNQTITVSDAAAANTSTGTSNAILVNPAAATHFAFAVAPLPTYSGVASAYPPSQSPAATSTFDSTRRPTAFTVTAEDAFGNTVPNYAGTVNFTSNDPSTNVSLPPSNTLTGGVGVFTAAFATIGNRVITATDASNSAITGATNPILTRGLVVTSFTPTPTGFVVTFNQAFNLNSIVMYTENGLKDDIMLATTSAQVSIKGSVLVNSPLAPTSLTFVKTEFMTASGSFNPGNGLLSAGKYTVTLRSYSGSTNDGFQDSYLSGALDGEDQGNPGVNYVYTFSVSTPPVAVGIPDFARGPSNADLVVLPASIGNGNTFNLIYTNTNSGTPSTGTATITFSTSSATLQQNIQSALNALSQIGTTNNAGNAVVAIQNPTTMATAGANVLITFQNTSYFLTATSQLLSSTTSGVSISLAALNVPNNLVTEGIPLAISNADNVTSGTFTLQYDPTLLNITGGVSKVAGMTFTVTADNTVGTAVISFSSPTNLSTSTTPTVMTLGSLLATVPFGATASYGEMQLLHFSSMQLMNTAGVSINVTNQDAVEVAAFFGDVTDTAVPFASSNDLAQISAVAGLLASTINQTLPGFTAFPLLDPVIIGSVSQLGGTIGTSDVTAMQRELTNPQPAIAWLPNGLFVTFWPQ